MNQALTLYQNAKQAIAEYKTVDEVKDFRDKALAVEAYAKQANDYELERDAAIARVRAERKCGELLADMEKAKGNQNTGVFGGRKELPPKPSQDGTWTCVYCGSGCFAAWDYCHDCKEPRVRDPKTLAEMGITKDQSSKWQKLAKVPEEEFEAAINLPGTKPSTNHIIRPKEEPAARMDANALWWWGRFVDIERDKIKSPLSAVVQEMTDAMKADADRIIPKLKKWINDYEQA